MRLESIELAGRACLLTVLEDITEQRRAEQALRESEELVSGAFRASPDAMSIADFATGLYLEVNEGFEKMFGYKRAEAIGRSALDLKILVEPAVSEQSAHPGRDQGRVRDLEIAVRTRSGEVAHRAAQRRAHPGRRPPVRAAGVPRHHRAQARRTGAAPVGGKICEGLPRQPERDFDHRADHRQVRRT